MGVDSGVWLPFPNAVLYIIYLQRGLHQRKLDSGEKIAEVRCQCNRKSIVHSRQARSGKCMLKVCERAGAALSIAAS